MFNNYEFTDGRGRYPDRITASAPPGLRDVTKRAASAESMSLSQFVRSAIESRIAHVLPSPDAARGER